MTEAESLNHQVWMLLSRVCGERDNPMRFGVLATVAENDSPTARTVVLRRVDTARRELWFHTDRRSPKVREIARDGRVSWLLYEPQAKVQLRLSGTAFVHTEGVDADALWRDVPPPVRTTYQSPLSPGTAIPTTHQNVPDAGGEAGREHFAAVCVRVDAIDYLQLRPEGHRRMRISCADVSSIRGEWLTP
jgi:hypothetical protein